MIESPFVSENQVIPKETEQKEENDSRGERNDARHRADHAGFLIERSVLVCSDREEQADQPKEITDDAVTDGQAIRLRRRRAVFLMAGSCTAAAHTKGDIFVQFFSAVFTKHLVSPFSL